jgi:hypothetical protein
LHSSTQLDFIQLGSGATTTVVNTGNVTQGVNVFNAGSQLTLAANLNLSGDVDLRGTAATPSTLDAGGFNISANNMFVGRFGEAGEVLNDGAITLLGNIHVSRGTFAFDANDTVAGGLFADFSATPVLHSSTQLDFIQLGSGATTTVVNTGNVTQGVNVFNAGSRLTLAANLNLSGDVDLRGTAATPSTLDAAGFNITANNMFVGRFGEAGEVLNDGAITLSGNMHVSRGTFAFDGNDTVAGGLFADFSATPALHPSTQLDFIQLNTGAMTTVVNTGNVTQDIALIDQGSALNLSANINLTGDIQIRGTGNIPSVIHANGMDIKGRNLFVGRFGASGSLLSADLVTLSSTLSVERSTLTFNGGFDVVGESLSLLTGSTMTVDQTADSTRGLSLDGNTLSILDTSVLELTFDATLNSFGDWIFRWENPNAGDRVATIQNLINTGKIVVNSPHPFNIVNNGDGFTYIAKFTRDFNSDTALNCADLNLLTAAIVAGSSNLLFDLTGDGQVTIADRDTWLARAGAVFIRSGNPFLPGDANLDGFVDGTDFGIWNANKFTTNSAWCSGDFNTDGFIDGSDFGIWNAFKFTASDGTNLVPEPTTAIGLWSLLAAGLVRSRSNRIPFGGRSSGKGLL